MRARSAALALLLSSTLPAPRAVAQETVEQFMERYETALDRADLDALAGVYADWDERKRVRLARYFASEVGELNVEISDVQATDAADGSVRVEFTRRDRFTDLATGRRLEKRTRLRRVLRRNGERWTFAAD